MKLKTEKIVNFDAFKDDLKRTRPRTRSSIKQEMEDSKEYIKRALYSPVKVKPISLKKRKEANSNPTDPLQHLSEGVKKRYCSICDRIFSNREIYLSHELHSHKAKEAAIYNPKTLYCNICKKTFESRTGYRRHMVVRNNSTLSQGLKLIPDPSKLPDIEDPNNYCVSCDFTLRDRTIYRQHLLIRHNIPRVTDPTGLKNLKDGPPIIDLLNLYCDVCKKVYDAKSIYLAHLVRIHKMVLPDIYSEQKNFDPKNLYCKTCDKKYKGMTSFKEHLKNIHNTELASRPLLPTDTNDKNNYCAVCERKFSNKQHYLDHIGRIHCDEDLDIFKGEDCPNLTKEKRKASRYCSDCKKVFLTRMFCQLHSEKMHDIKFVKRPKPPKSLPGAEDPDVEDPNNHCSSCDKTFSKRKLYLAHLSHVHHLIVSSKSKRPCIDNSIPPVIDLLKIYCNVCDRKYTSLRGYRTHMSRNHGIEIHRRRARKISVNRTEIPVASEIENHCTACDKVFHDRRGHRIHFRRIHGMLLPKLHPINEDITPDVDDKNHYCAACNRTYASRSSYRNHLDRAHKMKMKRPEKKN